MLSTPARPSKTPHFEVQRAKNELSGPVANHAMVRVDSSGAVVFFGGGPSTDDTDFAGNDLWVDDPATDTWTSG